MQNFEQKISEYTEKIIDPERPDIFYYKLNYKIRTSVMDLRDPLQVKSLPEHCTKSSAARGNDKMVKTPQGIFPNIKEAANHYDISYASVVYRCSHWTRDEFFYYKEEK